MGEFGVGPVDLAQAVGLQLGTQQGFFEVVAPGFGLGPVLHPILGKTLGNSQGRHPGKKRISGVLCGGGQQTGVKSFFADMALGLQQRLEDLPLVPAEVVQYQ